MALFERDGAAAVLRRLQAAALVPWVEDADYGTPLLSLDELIIQTRAVIRLLEDEREHLLRHGLRPTRNFTDFPAELLVNLYPIRPHWLTTWSKGAGLMAPGDEIQPGHGQVAEAAGVVLAPERPVVWMDEWDPPDWLPIAGSAATPDPEGQQQIDAYYEARWCAWLEPSEAVQLQAGRAKLLDLKLAVLRHLVDALVKRDEAGLWPGCLRLLTEALTASEAEFYLRMDERMRGDEIVVAAQKNLGISVYEPLGVLTDLLMFIGHCEKELRIGTLDRTRRSAPCSLAVLFPNPFTRYYEAIGEPWKTRLDATLDQWAELKAQEDVFWTEYRDRVNHALENAFDDEVTVHTRIKKPFAAKFELHLQKYAEWGKSLLEVSGSLPQLQLTHAVGPGRMRPYAFKREGEYWTLAYDGQVIRMRHTVGLGYIAILLRAPRKEHFPFDLEATLSGSNASSDAGEYGRMSREQLEMCSIFWTGLWLILGASVRRHRGSASRAGRAWRGRTSGA